MATATKISCDLCGHEEEQFVEQAGQPAGPEERGWGKLSRNGSARDICPPCFADIVGGRRRT